MLSLIREKINMDHRSAIKCTQYCQCLFQLPVMSCSSYVTKNSKATRKENKAFQVTIHRCRGPLFWSLHSSLRQTTAKRYGALFTCLAICAVHIEVVCSLDTESFINILQRFIARRGHPEQIRPHNGGNLVKGEKELRKALQAWNQAQIHECLLQHDDKWIFNPGTCCINIALWRCVGKMHKTGEKSHESTTQPTSS